MLKIVFNQLIIKANSIASIKIAKKLALTKKWKIEDKILNHNKFIITPDINKLTKIKSDGRLKPDI